MSVHSSTNHNYSEDVGVAYAVTNSKGITSTLMGTYHFIDAKSLQNPCFGQILKCSELFTEMGTHLQFNSNDGCFPGVVEHSIPYPHTVDGFLTIMAGWRKIPIRSLDHEVPEMQAVIALVDSIRQAIGGSEALGDLTVATLQAFQRPPFIELAFKPVVEAYQQGNLDELRKMRQMAKDTPDGEMLGTKRENKWSEILIPKLLEAEKPIGIAVGAAHVVGEDSLSERFAKAGLKVELITPKPRSHL